MSRRGSDDTRATTMSNRGMNAHRASNGKHLRGGPSSEDGNGPTGTTATDKSIRIEVSPSSGSRGSKEEDESKRIVAKLDERQSAESHDGGIAARLGAAHFSELDKQRRLGFDVSVAELCQLVAFGEPDKCKRNLAQLGGLLGVADKLKTGLHTGISGDPEDLSARKEVFHTNEMPKRPYDSFLKLLLDAFKDPVLIILLIAAIISLGIGAYEQHSTGEQGWVDGVAILIAVAVVSLVSAGNDYKKQLQFLELEDASDADIKVTVIRNGRQVEIRSPEVLVGDIVELEGGSQVPADGLCVSSDKCKLSSANLTGESDDLDCDPIHEPVVLSGMQVSSGSCQMLVVAVGERSMQGRIRKATAQVTKETPLQEKLEIVVKKIGYFGVIVALLTFIAMMVMISTSEDVVDDAGGVGRWVLRGFIIMITIVVVAIPEGLPLAVTISLAYSTMRMMEDKNLVRVLSACETMGNATDICSDKTGTLTQNQMKVSFLYVPDREISLREFDMLDSLDQSKKDRVVQETFPNHIRDVLFDHVCLNTTAFLQPSEDEKKRQAGILDVSGSKTPGAGLFLAHNAGVDPEKLRKDTVTEGRYLKHHLFDSSRKMASTIYTLRDDHPSSPGKTRILLTGAPEIIMARCTRWQDYNGNIEKMDEDKKNAVLNGQNAMTEKALRTLAYAYIELDSMSELPGFQECPEKRIKEQLKSLPHMSEEVARHEIEEAWYRETNQPWSVDANSVENIGLDSDSSSKNGFIFYAMLGIEDPLRPDVVESVKTCQNAGIRVRMVTGDNRSTAEAIARQCGILTDDGVVIEGPEFRQMTIAEVDRILPKLQVMARSSPEDKHMLVRRINGNVPRTEQEWKSEHPGLEFTEQNWRTVMPGFITEWEEANFCEKANVVYKPVVGVTGDGTNDAPALKAADVGLSMGISGTDVARNASDIVILDDNFTSIVNSVMWGRSVYDNIRKFLQFQLTVNVVALTLTFLAAVTQRDPPLNAVMMLWVNLIMDSMGALALGTELPTRELLSRKPFASRASLLSPKMWRHIIFQSIFQLGLLMGVLLTDGSGFGISRSQVADFLGQEEADSEEFNKYLNTFIFNAFVFAQVFNEFNARSIGDNWNVFKRLHTNKIFIGVIVVTIALQIFIIEVGGRFTETAGLQLNHWFSSVGLGALSLPIGIIMRWVPARDRPSDFAEYYLQDPGIGDPTVIEEA